MELLVAVFLIVSCSVTNSWIVEPGPLVIATKGEVWPMPQHQQKFDNFYSVQASSFRFNVISEDCTILQQAIGRYDRILIGLSKLLRTSGKNHNSHQSRRTHHKHLGVLSSLDISLTSACQDAQYPELNMDESYNLAISNSAEVNALLSSNSIWGILRGLETFSQLMYVGDDETTVFINATTIRDFPRFAHRGLLLDTARHYLPMDVIYKQLDAMAYNKMNVFHWHIVDDQSFPYQSVLYPELSAEGAYHPIRKIYTRQDLKDVIEYARLRGIRVVPEFDTPGHTRSWGEGIPELLTACYENNLPTGQYGPMNPSRPFLYEFLAEFFDEVNSTFPDRYVHLGGDEVPYECWESNGNVVNYMDSMNMTGDFKALEKFYMERLLDITTPKNIIPIVWEEVFLANVNTPNNAVIQVWMGGYSSLREVTEAGKQVLYSSCWYLDHLLTGGDWSKFYNCDPEDFGGTDDQLRLILGGEACMWGEVVNRQNVLQRTWPRASAVAEKLWSAHNADTYPEAQKRLEEHTCRMNIRDIPAQPPNGPGYCLL